MEEEKYQLDDEKYIEIKKMVYFFLHRRFWNRHYEDCVSFCCVEWLLGRRNIQWSVIRFLKSVGLHRESKRGSVAVESASNNAQYFRENEDTVYNEQEIALDKHAYANYLKNDSIDEFENLNLKPKESLSDFLKLLDLTQEVRSWALKSYHIEKTKPLKLISIRQKKKQYFL